MKLNISNDTAELSRNVAGWLVNYVKEVLTKHERFTIALSGGNTPKQLFKLLASDAYRNRINWKKVHVFWGDERFVPFNDERNNAKMAFDTLLSHVPIPEQQAHPIRTDISPEDSARDYEKILHQYFDRQLYTFDLVFLGLGDNAHTLSLFPGYDDILFEKQAWVKSFMLHEQEMHRITLTPPVVNGAGRTAFLVAGSDKAEAITHIVSGEYDPAKYPAQLIRPLNNELYWFIDKPASSGLQYQV